MLSHYHHCRCRCCGRWGYLSRAVLKRQIRLNQRMRGYYVARIVQTSEPGVAGAGAGAGRGRRGWAGHCVLWAYCTMFRRLLLLQGP